MVTHLIQSIDWNELTGRMLWNIGTQSVNRFCQLRNLILYIQQTNRITIVYGSYYVVSFIRSASAASLLPLFALSPTSCAFCRWYETANVSHIFAHWIRKRFYFCIAWKKKKAHLATIPPAQGWLNRVLCCIRTKYNFCWLAIEKLSYYGIMSFIKSAWQVHYEHELEFNQGFVCVPLRLY